MNQLIITSVGDISFAGAFSDKCDATAWLDPVVKEALKGDIVIGNLECVLVPDGESVNVSELCLAEGAFNCLNALKSAGFNVVTLGNNHIMDFKQEEGLKYTMQSLSEAGICFCGAGLNIEEARKPAIIETPKYKVAIFSRVYAPSFVDVTNIVAAKDKAGVALLDSEEIQQTVLQYRDKEGCDTVILAIHWGAQNLHYYPPEFYRIAKRLFENGVDLILGSHSHVLQGLSNIDGKFAFWGQGNFYFHPFFVRHGVKGRLVYGPDAAENRISAIGKFHYTEGSWSAQVIPVVQKADNRVEKMEIRAAMKVRRSVLEKWNRPTRLRFCLEWRKAEFSNILDSVRTQFRVRGLKQGLSSLLHPLKWLRALVRVILHPLHR